jgi:hypothetical protein
MATLSYSVTEPALRSPVEEWQPHAKQSESVSNNLIKKNAGGILLTDENNSNHDNLVDGNDVEDNIPDCGITLPSHPPAGSDLNIGDASFGVFRWLTDRLQSRPRVRIHLAPPASLQVFGILFFSA